MGSHLAWMRCTPKKTVALLHQQGNDYVISVKANQPKLYQTLQRLAHQAKGDSLYLESERTRGRHTTRIASVFALPQSLQQYWVGAQQGIEMIRFGTRRGMAYLERHYYITSWQDTAAALLTRIRAHWGIENPLHWVKDVVLDEDHSSISTHSAATLMAFIRNLVITLFRRAGYHSITEAIDLCSNDLSRLLPMLDFPSG